MTCFLGEEIKEPEVDLSAFLEKQRRSDVDVDVDVDANQALALSFSGVPVDAQEEDEDEIDDTLAHITSQRRPALQSKKGRVQTIEWDESLERMSREKAVAEANRGSSSVLVTAEETRSITYYFFFRPAPFLFLFLFVIRPEGKV